MSEYTVTLAGLQPGTDPDRAAAQFGKAFKIGSDRAQALIAGSKRIGNCVTRERTEKYLEVLGRMGIDATVSPPLAESEAAVSDAEVDELAETIVQLPGQGPAPVSDPDAAGDEPKVDEHAATVMIASPIADPEAAGAVEADDDIDPNAATVIAAVPVRDPDAADDVDPNAATVIAALPVRDPDVPPREPPAAEPAGAEATAASEEPKGFLAKLKRLFGR